MFKNNLKAYRELRKLSQTKLADMIGVSRSLISMYESGERKPSFEVLEAIADTLNASFNDLMGVDEAEYRYGINKYRVRRQVPRLGRIPCGEPNGMDENIEGFDDLPDGITADYTLLCEGDSMINAQILDGDVVYIAQQETVDNGEIAAVWYDGATTLKRFYKNGDTVTLMPENPRFAPIFISGADLSRLKVLGRAVGFTRIFK